MKATMYVAHGSRLPEKNREFRHFVDQIMQKRPESCQKIAFLEKEDETMAIVGESIIAAGAKEITVVPMLLFPAMHATKDIPDQVAQLKKQHPDVVFRIADTFGAEQEVAAVAAAKIKATRPDQDAAILVVAHGSASYTEPRTQMQTVTALIATQLQLPVALGMLHGEPNYRTIATELAAKHENVHWMPYFLFQGQLVDKIRAGITEISGTQWHEADSLDLDTAMITAVLRKITEVTK